METYRNFLGDINSVKLNVGGKVFEVELSVFGKRESFFSMLFCGYIPHLKDENGFFFVDRDGTHFQIILDYLIYGGNYIRDSDINCTTKELYQIISEAKFYSLHELENIILEKLGIYLIEVGENMLNYHLTGGKAKIKYYSNFENAHAYNLGTEEGSINSSWQNNGMFVESKFLKNSDEYSYRDSNSIGSTWQNSLPGTSTGTVIVDLTQKINTLRKISRFCLFQMVSDGAVTSMRISYHNNTTDQFPAYDAQDWITAIDWAPVGKAETVDQNDLIEEDIDRSRIIKRTELWICPSFETRYLKIDAINDGSNGTNGYIEVRQLRAYEE